MKNLRKEDTSLYLYLKDVVLSEFIEKQESVQLNYIEELSNSSSKVYDIDDYFDPSPKSRGRGFVYFDDLTNEPLVPCVTSSGTKEQIDRITVYNNVGSIITDDYYIVDYIDCRIIAEPEVEPATIDYHWNYVSLIDEWTELQSTEPPVVVIELSHDSASGFQLGGGRKNVRKCILHIFGSDSAERNELVDVIFNSLYLKRCPLYELEKGTPLDYDGTFYGRKATYDKDSTLFSRTTVSGVSHMEFDNVKARNVRLPNTITRGFEQIMLSDLNSYRAEIQMDVITYIE